jgi:hypothetical protein
MLLFFGEVELDFVFYSDEEAKINYLHNLSFENITNLSLLQRLSPRTPAPLFSPPTPPALTAALASFPSPMLVLGAAAPAPVILAAAVSVVRLTAAAPYALLGRGRAASLDGPFGGRRLLEVVQVQVYFFGVVERFVGD